MNLDAIDLGSLAGAATGSMSGLLDVLLSLSRGSVFGGSTIGDLGSAISFS
ncbi:hypothetical protein AB4Z09_02685 [Rhodococcus sp. TAF43]|uniref:hypothetical protein n=1 Tax=unclassified Rhodococcus (in: high G+C Gram-positive bacteria) TaxID=192944 RepID=UPI000E2DA3F3|nr:MULTISPECIES: hypothetical protein [unclassified Rhodococcus (in: high G+C Gram-positive bacteria)]QKT13025.1 hypothetical protein HUN07_21970 [Rhodococcus sp. W8901]RDI33686.1 hypothetical protein DEU38_10241 [Rhodococcus sp. AG1013]